MRIVRPSRAITSCMFDMVFSKVMSPGAITPTGRFFWPIALIEKNLPVVVIAPGDMAFEKPMSNMHEVIAREGRTILITDHKGASLAAPGSWAMLALQDMPALVAPLVFALPLQLLAYHTALVLGTDVDQPRNLAKSVTVE